MNGSRKEIVPAWLRHAAYAAATLFVWVFALVLFGAVLGSVVGLLALGGPHGACIGALRGGGVALAVALPFYVAGIVSSVQDNLRPDGESAARPQTSDAASHARSITSLSA